MSGNTSDILARIPYQPEKLTWEVVSSLGQAFPDAEHKYLPLSTRPNGNGQVKAFAYVDARAIMRRLDQVVGPGNWTFIPEIEHLSDTSCVVRGHLAIFGVVKSDVGEAQPRGQQSADRASEIVKSATSDALKRCASMHGIGRYLYELNLFLPWSSQYNRLDIKAWEYKIPRNRLGAAVRTCGFVFIDPDDNKHNPNEQRDSDTMGDTAPTSAYSGHDDEYPQEDQSTPRGASNAGSSTTGGTGGTTVYKCAYEGCGGDKGKTITKTQAEKTKKERGHQLCKDHENEVPLLNQQKTQTQVQTPPASPPAAAEVAPPPPAPTEVAPPPPPAPSTASRLTTDAEKERGQQWVDYAFTQSVIQEDEAMELREELKGDVELNRLKAMLEDLQNRVKVASGQ